VLSLAEMPVGRVEAGMQRSPSAFSQFTSAISA
jgi:hypothetical protein